MCARANELTADATISPRLCPPSREQDAHRQTRRTGPAHPTDAVAQRRGPVQRRRMRHQPRHPRSVGTSSFPRPHAGVPPSHSRSRSSSRCPLSFSDENKNKIAKSGALIPLTRLARSKDMRVQRNATGALLNMTHSDENRQQLVSAGAIPVLVGLLNSEDTDVQYYCTTALSNIAVDCQCRPILSSRRLRLSPFVARPQADLRSLAVVSSHQPKEACCV